MNYIQYICKNPKCDSIFLAEDLYNRSTPEHWRYCPECEAIGFEVIRENLKNTNHKNLTKYWQVKQSTPTNKNGGVLAGQI